MNSGLLYIIFIVYSVIIIVQVLWVGDLFGMLRLMKSLPRDATCQVIIGATEDDISDQLIILLFSCDVIKRGISKRPLTHSNTCTLIGYYTNKMYLLLIQQQLIGFFRSRMESDSDTGELLAKYEALKSVNITLQGN